MPKSYTKKTNPKKSYPRWLVPVVGYTIAAASLYWAFHRFPYRNLANHLRHMDWRWVSLAILFEFAVYFADAWRWQALVKPVGANSFRICLQAVLVGLFANDVLPARAGELIRCFLLSFETEVPLSLSFTSDIMIRVMDGLWLVILYLFITLQIETHVVVSRIMWGFAAGVAVAALLLLFVLFHRHRARHFPARFQSLLAELHQLGRWKELGLSMARGSLYWLAQMLAVWAIAKADSFDFGLAGASFILIVKTVGTLLPNAPANIGAYKATTMYALGLMLVERPNAQIFSEIMFWFLTLPPAVAGAIAVAFAGYDLTDIHKKAVQARERHNRGTRLV